MNEIELKDRIIGMFLGIAIGDALGMPVEFIKADKKDSIGWVDKYIRPDGHKWFDGRNAGTWTDDWFYTRIVLESLIANNGFDIDDLAKRHAESYLSGEYKIGAGGATRKAIKKLAEGEHWSKSGTPNAAGNGVAMKVAPLSLIFLASKIDFRKFPKLRQYFTELFYESVCSLALMTHNSTMAAASALAHINAIASSLCDHENVEQFENCFLRSVVDSSKIAEKLLLNDEQEKLSSRFDWLQTGEYKNLSVGDLNRKLGPDTGYVYYTLPFCYGAFLKNPTGIDTLYEVVNAGGDTDTNGSIVGSLLGSYNGKEIFPEHLVSGLDKVDEIIDLAERFCQKFI